MSARVRKKRRIALFGGSFNPPHVAHQLVALYVLETQPVDALWFIPTFAHPFGKPLAPFRDRVKMCTLAAAPLGARAAVMRTEEELAKQPGFVASRTYELVGHLARANRDANFRLVIGADILRETTSWYEWDELERQAPPIVVSRPGYPGGTGCAIDTSSTRVRELLAARDPAATALVPRTVMRYIDAHSLYR